MESILRARQIVYEVLETIGIDTYEARVSRDAWAIAMGSVVGIIGICPDEKNPDESLFFCKFRIMKVPIPMALPFYRQLLEANFRFFGLASLAIDSENIVWLLSARKIEDIDASEVHNMILTTAGIADQVDDEFLDEFGWKYRLDDE